MADGWPDAARLTRTIGGHITQARASAGGQKARVAAFGEMVAILCAQVKMAAATRLEELWNEFASAAAFRPPLRCLGIPRGWRMTRKSRFPPRIAGKFDQRSPPFREQHRGDPHHRRRFRRPPRGQGSRQGNAAGSGGIDPRLMGHVRRRFAGDERTHAPIGRHAGNLVLRRRNGGSCRRSAPGLDARAAGVWRVIEDRH